jgi:sugar phosphate isomerase/epimerase
VIGESRTVMLATILVEPNRWSTRTPSVSAARWIDRALSDGFGGIELWEPHYADSSSDERAALEARSDCIAVFNSYCTFDSSGAAGRQAAAAAAATLGVGGVKFNVGKDPAEEQAYRSALVAWIDNLDAVPLCECHPGTIVETPESAAEFFADPDLSSVRMIVHPFRKSEEEITRWFDLLGDRIVHAHVQIRDNENHFLLLEEAREEVHDRIDLLRRLGFSGSWALEFAAGTRTSDDTPEFLYRNALSDMAVLQELLR